MTDHDWQLALEKLRGRMSVQEQKHLSLERDVEKRLSKIETNTNRLVWLLVAFLIGSVLSNLLGDRLQIPPFASAENISLRQ